MMAHDTDLRMGRRTLLAGAATSGVALPLSPVRAEDRALVLGVLTDMAGPYADNVGAGSILAAQFAVADHAAIDPRLKATVIGGDMQDKPDVGASIARSWVDESGVDVILDVPQSTVAIAVGEVVKQRDKLLITQAGLPELTGKYCSPNQIQWTYDLWSFSNCTARAVVQAGGKRWFFITGDILSGRGIERDTSKVVRQLSGEVVGSVLYPTPGTTDFSSQLLQAVAAGADVVCLANAGADTINCIKQAHEFGLVQKGIALAAIIMTTRTIHSLGLDQTQGLIFASPFDWDMDERTRAFAGRFQQKMAGAKPSFYHAGIYSAATHTLRAASALGLDRAKASGRALCQQMKAMPTDDPLFGPGEVRADGKFLHPMYVWKVKSPGESKGAWDFCHRIGEITAVDAFQSAQELGCNLT